MKNSIFPWSRMWLPQGSKFALDYEGFPLYDSTHWQNKNLNAFPLCGLSELPCLVLLGEPGMGKSTEISNVSSEINPNTIKFPIKDYSSELYLFSQLDLKIREESSSVNKNFIYLDGFDEAQLRISTISTNLVQWLDRNSGSLKISKERVDNHFYLRITCRSAIWESETTDLLKGIFGEDNVSIYEIGGLQKEDIEIACKSLHIDEKAFIKAVKDAELIDFAIEPITLQFLLLEFATDQNKFKNLNKLQIFEKGLLRLSEEVNRTYIKTTKLTCGQRFEIASRIAFYSIFSNKASILKKGNSKETIDGCLCFDDVVGDNLAFPDVGKNHLVTYENVREVSETGLFTLYDDNQIKWKHRSFPEFLAAWHLKEIKLPLAPIKQLIISQNQGDRIVPQLVETVIWLTHFNREIFLWLLTHEPHLLLRSKDEFSSNDKERIVKGLIEKANDFEYLDSHEDRKFYEKLDYENLTGLLAHVLKDTSATRVAKRIALRIICECRLKGLNKELLHMLNDKNLPIYSRRLAIEGLSVSLDLNVIEVLKKYALGENHDDYNDDLKGESLKQLFPTYIETKEVLRTLTKVKKKNLYASYQSFLSTVGNKIPTSDLHIALDEIANHEIFSKNHGYNDFADLIEVVIKRSWDNLLINSKISNCLAQLLYKFSISHIQLQVPDDPVKRRIILFEIIKLGEAERLIFYDNPLFKQEDWEWYVSLLSKIERPESRKILYRLIEFFDWTDVKKAKIFLELCFTSKELNERFKSILGPVELGSKESLRLKSNHYKFKKHSTNDGKSTKKKVSFSFTKTLRNSISKIRKRNYDAFWQLIASLGIHEEGHFLHQDHYQFDITKLNNWEKIEKDYFEEICSFAIVYLKEFETTNITVQSLPFLAKYKAILLLYKLKNNLYKELRASGFFKGTEWGALFVYSTLHMISEFQDDQKELLAEYYKSNKNDFIEQLFKYLGNRITQSQNIPIGVKNLEVILDDDLIKIFLKLIKAKGYNFKEDTFVEMLFQYQYSSVSNIAWKYFSLLFTNSIKEAERELAFRLTHELLLTLDIREWTRFYKIFSLNTNTAKELFLAVASKISYRDNNKFSDLGPKDKAELYLWIVENFPRNEDPQHKGAYIVQAVDYVVEIRNKLLNEIIVEGSLEAVEALEHLKHYFGDKEDYKWHLLSSKEYMRKKTFTPPSILNLKQILENTERRLVRSPEELVTVVLESLEKLEKKLQGFTPTAMFLWDKQQKSLREEVDFEFKYKPKDENSLSDFIKMHLEYDLVGKGIVINREVEVKKSTGIKDGSRLDLLIQAFFKNPSNIQQIDIIIEVKGCWNGEVETAMQEQLNSKYLGEHKGKHGIFLIGWYYCNHLKKPKTVKDKAQLKEELAAQSKMLLSKGTHIHPLIIDCTI